jgi:hypothetical protein
VDGFKEYAFPVALGGTGSFYLDAMEKYQELWIE